MCHFNLVVWELLHLDCKSILENMIASLADKTMLPLTHLPMIFFHLLLIFFHLLLIGHLCSPLPLFLLFGFRGKVLCPLKYKTKSEIHN